MTPEGILCAKSHEWVQDGENTHKVGITDVLGRNLGDIVFVELPEVGSSFSLGEVFATLESVKGASEVFMPISGKIINVNERLINAPEILNDDPFGEGWLVEVESDTFTQDSIALLEYEDYLEDAN